MSVFIAIKESLLDEETKEALRKRAIREKRSVNEIVAEWLNDTARSILSDQPAKSEEVPV